MRRILQIICLTMLLSSCAQCRPMVVTEYRDSIRVVERRDSVRVEKMDSIYIDRYLRGDTMYITKERWRVEYRDRIREVRDTIRDTQTKTETIEKRYIPSAYRWAMGIAVTLALLIAAVAAWRIYRFIKI